MPGTLENIGDVIGKQISAVTKIIQRRGPKSTDLSFMVGKTYGSLTVNRVYYDARDRHQHAAASCNACFHHTYPRASDVLAGKSESCCKSKDNYKRHKEAIALRVTTPAQRRAIFRSRIGRPFKRFKWESRDNWIVARFQIPSDLIGPIVRLERKRLVDLYPTRHEMWDAAEAGLISWKEFEFCISLTQSEPLVLTLQDVIDDVTSAWAKPFLHLLSPSQLSLAAAA